MFFTTKLFPFNVFQVSYFSTKTEKLPIHFKGNFFECFLPSIDTNNPNIDTSYIAKEDTFSDYLDLILHNLARSASGKNKEYRFIFKVYMHSNKKSDLEKLLSPGEFPEYISVLEKPINLKDSFKSFLNFKNYLIFNTYKYHGYGQIYSIRFNLNDYSDNNYEKLVNLCKDLILKRIKNINEDLESNEFIESNQWVLLHIIRIPN